MNQLQSEQSEAGSAQLSSESVCIGNGISGPEDFSIQKQQHFTEQGQVALQQKSPETMPFCTSPKVSSKVQTSKAPTILVLGGPGDGKSALCKMMHNVPWSETDAITEHGGPSLKSTAASRRLLGVGEIITVVDTPGLGDMSLKFVDWFEDAQQMLASISSSICAVVVVVPTSNPRLTSSQILALTFIREVGFKANDVYLAFNRAATAPNLSKLIKSKLESFASISKLDLREENCLQVDIDPVSGLLHPQFKDHMKSFADKARTSQGLDTTTFAIRLDSFARSIQAAVGSSADTTLRREIHFLEAKGLLAAP